MIVELTRGGPFEPFWSGDDDPPAGVTLQNGRWIMDVTTVEQLVELAERYTIFGLVLIPDADGGPPTLTPWDRYPNG